MALFKIVVWAIIFLTKLRFPPGISIATVLKDRYKNNGSLAAFRKYQRIDLKLSKAKLDLSFLTKCKSHGVIPQFLNFKVTNQRLKSSAAYRQCQRKLLEEEIFNKQCRICELKIELSTVYGCLADLVSSLDLVHLKTLSESENSKQLQRHENIQERKLFRLSVSTANTGKIDPDKVIFNHSDRVLTEQEKFVLSRGLNFSIPPRKLNYVDFLISFELLHKTRLKNIALSGYRNYTAPPFVFSSDEFKVLKNLKNDNSIFIIKPDKRNGVVIINRDDYWSKMESILSDTNHF